jgi:hypothetical protein
VTRRVFPDAVRIALRQWYAVRAGWSTSNGVFVSISIVCRVLLALLPELTFETAYLLWSICVTGGFSQKANAMKAQDCRLDSASRRLTELLPHRLVHASASGFLYVSIDISRFLTFLRARSALLPLSCAGDSPLSLSRESVPLCFDASPVAQSERSNLGFSLLTLGNSGAVPHLASARALTVRCA